MAKPGKIGTVKRANRLVPVMTPMIDKVVKATVPLPDVLICSEEKDNNGKNAELAEDKAHFDEESGLSFGNEVEQYEEQTSKKDKKRAIRGYDAREEKSDSEAEFEIPFLSKKGNNINWDEAMRAASTLPKYSGKKKPTDDFRVLPLVLPNRSKCFYYITAEAQVTKKIFLWIFSLSSCRVPLRNPR